jgi:hypothetical protein
VAIIGFLLGIVAWWMSGSLTFAFGAIALVTYWPWTIFGIMATNKALMAIELNDAGPRSRALIVKWNRLHSVRTISGGPATVAFLSALLLN